MRINKIGDTLETAVLCSLKKDDIEEFERNMVQLRSFYNEAKDVLKDSPNKYSMIGLYLLFLVYKNRTADYYTELELLTLEDQKNPCIAVALTLEQHFVDGNYLKILNTKQNVPIPIYNYFIDKLIDTVRYETARSAEKAYKQLRVSDACKMFMLGSAGELEAFVNQQKSIGLDNNVAWVLNKDLVHFEPLEKERLTIPTDIVINQSLELANELEKIV